jgi:DNA-directed RNA polymerase I, II, and III subunit RPABC5|uniref:DNA-directed RNA polymerase n=1 Tax=viral metagenome TaxID=1070528 RepID=A0A6C0I8I5_9ZZZZ
MLIPIRCVTCNNILAGKWDAYLDLVKKNKVADGRAESDEILYLTKTTIRTAEGRAMDTLGLDRECCRRHMLTHVDLL